ncbi:DNA-directed RNA polymerase I subunit RPA1-like [Uloborus diversus]|uniref:DNA-directed RNA polymerase I subunit RPA1-like n=1 Tax=Uloborus diversus TaxID=327109 RepID=UPI00240A22E3|nr:DNA-directed RNA polymerase I subunit RPA1-like [Uloborus diversus]
METESFKTIKGLSFGIYTTEEIKKISVLEVTNTEILDSLGHASPGGLHDLRLGPNEKDEICETCDLNFFKCPGHLGHISLPVPVYNPAIFLQLYQLLRGICFNCHHLLAPTVAKHLVLYQLQALDYGLIGIVQELSEVVTDVTELDASNSLSGVQDKLQRKFIEATEGLDQDLSNEPCKSIVECRKDIIRNFIGKHMMRVSGKCPHCRHPRRKLTRNNMSILYVDGTTVKKESGVSGSGDADIVALELSNRELLPEDARQSLHKLWENEKVLLRQLYKTLLREDTKDELAIDMFFMNVIAVPPSRFRRLNYMKGSAYADSQTLLFNEALKDCVLIKTVYKLMKGAAVNNTEQDVISKLPGKTNVEKLNYSRKQLQRHVYEIFDSDVNKDKNKVSKGIKQILEKKEGLFRMNMMGKRVNFAARSVISPDPYIMVNEIGVPLVFAKKLTFSEPVSPRNFMKLYHAVKNGPEVHPGATLVEYEDGRVVRLSADDAGQRHAIASTLLTPTGSFKMTFGIKRVHRHLQNGDMLLLNRQPTLHKPSIMAHKARVLPGEKTLRLHYANCKSYNADFDGDEMNAHFPQSYHGQAECRYIVNVNHQYLVPKDGTPLSGLIQDHIIGGTLLTMRGRFFTEEKYHRLIYSALSFSSKTLKFLPPALIRPYKLWSGKQVVSTIIINLIPDGKKPPTFEGKTKISSKNWKSVPERKWEAGGTPLKGDNMSESEVIIRDGELLCGVIDKAQVGPQPYSLIHICYELYSGETSTLLLTAFTRLFTHYNQYYSGFSLGIEDIVVTSEANKLRRRTLRKAKRNGLKATAIALEVTNPEEPNKEELLYKYKQVHFNRDDFGLKMLDVEMKKVTQSLNNDVNEICIINGLKKRFPKNNLQLMIESGAKGSSVNALQISCLLGQIELEGRRMPLMMNGSTLPSFLPYDSSPGAGGFVGGRFLSGLNPQEFFFHCMAGREGLIDTAVKTSRSGYLQRCLIKHLEGITVNYDYTVRDSDGTVLQLLYGEDGLDIVKSQMLKEKSLHHLAQNYEAAINKNEVEQLLNIRESNPEKTKKKIRKWKKKHSVLDNSRRSLLTGVENKAAFDCKSWHNARSYAKSLISDEDLKQYEKQRERCPDPVNSYMRSDLTFGSVCEKIDGIISNYVKNNPHCLLNHEDSLKQSRTISDSEFKDVCYYRYIRSLAEPGEPVGLLAAQSIGEPSTQMTLNTFHFAGKGEMNVTLGIPRIREILMTASPNIATPTMELPLLDRPDVEKKAEELKLKLSPVTLKELLEYVNIKEYLSVPGTGMNTRNYQVKMSFLKYSEYKGYLNTSPSQILKYIETIFLKKILEAIKKKLRIASMARIVNEVKDTQTASHNESSFDEEAPVATAGAKEDEGESSGEDEAAELDTDTAKNKMHHEEQEYEDPEDEEMLPESGEESGAEEEVRVKEEIISDAEDQTNSNNSNEGVHIKEKKYQKVCIGEKEKAVRINKVKCIHSWISEYDFDVQRERWCEVTFQLTLDSSRIDMKTLLEDEINKAYVYAVPHIKQAVLLKKPDAKDGPKFKIQTNGVNFQEIFKYVDILDINKVYSNNIHAIAENYGIEAATRAIRKEIVNVFAAYGIEVDSRHLSLISDYMTCSGYYRPCNRKGMEANASPLQQMTFETTKNFMVDAMFNGVEDRLKSPSANIIVGKLSGVGTGCFGLRCKPGRRP